MRSFLNDFSEYMRSLASEHNDILNSDNDRHYFRGGFPVWCRRLAKLSIGTMVRVL